MRYLILLNFALLAWSCKKDPTTSVVNAINQGITTQNDVKVNVTNMADNVVLQLSPAGPYTAFMPTYVNLHGDTFSVSKFKYFVTNIKLRRSDSTYFVEPESYHLVDAADTNGTCKFTLKSVPIGSYVSMEFLIGVDAARDTSGAQTGDLAQTDDMYWSWNQGYIFLKLEGYSNSAPPAVFNNLEYHVGGFVPPFSNIRKVTLPFTQNTLIVDQDHVSKLYLKTNIQEFFRNPDTINVATMPIVTSASAARLISINYSDMFSVAAVVH